jgi:hypothetical protein
MLYQQQQGTRPQQVDPLEQEIRPIDQQLENLTQRLKGQLTDAEVTDLQKEWTKLQTEKTRRIARFEGRQAAAASSATAASNTIAQQMEYEHPDIYRDPIRKNVAFGVLNELIAKGNPQNMATFNKALDITRSRTGLRPRNPISDRSRGDRNRMSGVGRSSSGGDRSAAAAPKNALTLKMAKTAHPTLSDDKAWAAWTRGAAKRATAK